MAIVTRRRCDNCRREVDEGSPFLAHWYEVWRNHASLYRSEGEQERFDICSTPCLAAWANSRELIANAL